MKKPNCRMEFIDERNEDILRAFRHAALSSHSIRIADIAQDIAKMPARRFWVSEERAVAVVSAMVRGYPVLHHMLPCKQRMYLEIFRRAMELQKRYPDSPLKHLVDEVLEQPAPEFYMEPISIQDVIYKVQRARRKGYGKQD